MCNFRVVSMVHGKGKGRPRPERTVQIGWKVANTEMAGDQVNKQWKASVASEGKQPVTGEAVRSGVVDSVACLQLTLGKSRTHRVTVTWPKTQLQ